MAAPVETTDHQPEAPAANGHAPLPRELPPDVLALAEPPDALAAADQRVLAALQELLAPPAHDRTLDLLVTALVIERGKVMRAAGHIQELQRALADIRAQRGAESRRR